MGFCGPFTERNMTTAITQAAKVGLDGSKSLELIECEMVQLRET